MITSDHQLQITKQHLAEFSSQVEELKTRIPKDNNDRLRLKAHIDSRESFIEEFQEDIVEWESQLAIVTDCPNESSLP